MSFSADGALEHGLDVPSEAGPDRAAGDRALRIPASGWARYAAAALVATLLPLLLAPLELPFISGTYHPGYRPYELFGFTASLAVLSFLARAAWQRRGLVWRPALSSLMPALLPALVGLHYLHIVTEFSGGAWDWGCYQDAARRVLEGGHPYGDCYLYPPLPAQALAGAERLLAAAAPLLGWSEGTSWGLLLYVYQCCQFFLLQLAAALCFLLARRLGLSALAAGAIVAALFLINNPIVRTLRHLQVNLWVLDLVLLAILGAARRPRLAGACLALSIHIKLQPAVLLGAWGISRRWRPLAAALLAASALVALELGAGQAYLWTAFLESSQRFPLGRALRDNSLHSLAYNLLRFPGEWLSLSAAQVAAATTISAALASACALCWLGLRALRREGRLGAGAPPAARPIGHSMDALALPLLCSPLVWEHHYVMALPIAVWAIACAGASRPFWIASACILVFGVPTFDVFPFSYHRLAGLLMLVGAVPPAAAPTGARDEASPDLRLAEGRA